MAIATTTRPGALSGAGVSARVSRGWAWAGLGTLILGFAFTWAPALFGVSDSDAKDPDKLFAALDTTSNLWIGRVSSGVGFLSVAALIVFASGYRRFLKERMPDSLVPDVAHGALMATAGALVIASVLRAMLFDSMDYYDNSMHSTMYALSWDVSLASWTVVFAAAGASAVAAYRGALPKWFGWLSVVTATFGVVLALSGLSFPAHMPAFIWLLCASIVTLRAARDVRV
jgi:hypothetical protein